MLLGGILIGAVALVVAGVLSLRRLRKRSLARQAADAFDLGGYMRRLPTRGAQAKDDEKAFVQRAIQVANGECPTLAESAAAGIAALPVAEDMPEPSTIAGEHLEIREVAVKVSDIVPEPPVKRLNPWQDHVSMIPLGSRKQRKRNQNQLFYRGRHTKRPDKKTFVRAEPVA